jgi:NADH-quinone oxidoreductase subunit J
MTQVIFFVFGALTLAGAFGVVLARNPVHCALSLVVTLVSVAVLFLQQDAHLLAAVQVVVYAGAIVVLFLFVIMLLGIDHPDTLRDPLRGQRVGAIILGAVLLAEVVFLTGHQWATGAKAPAVDAIHGGTPGLGNNVERIARSMFTEFLWPFEITAALLVLAVIGAVVLARRSRSGDEAATEDVS